MHFELGAAGFSIQALFACLLALGLCWLALRCPKHRLLLLIAVAANFAWIVSGAIELAACLVEPGEPADDPTIAFFAAMSLYASVLFLAVAIAATVYSVRQLVKSRVA